MNIPPITLLFFLGSFVTANGEDTNKITGKINDGGEKAMASASPQSYRVLSCVRKTRKLREIIFRQIEAPEVNKRLKWSSPTKQLEKGKLNHSFVVSSMTFPGKGTKVRWWSTGESDNQAYECWSNVDWKNLGGFHRFESRTQSFSFMLFRRSVQALENGEAPPELPDLNKGARYMVMVGDETNDAAMDFIEGLHEIYDLREKDLKMSAAQREVAAVNRLIEREQKEENPPVKKIEINFWPLTPEQKAR